MKRYGQIARLKPEKIEEYIELHAAVWPEVLKILKTCNLSNYSIYIQGDILFCYFEYLGDDYTADMAKMEGSELMQQWWRHTKPCFAGHEKEEYYVDLREIFHNQ